ncbi:hypothetical protein [Paenibacillus luteus]|nr:hypothetical protein [Paenibacillus luteus]
MWTRSRRTRCTAAGLSRSADQPIVQVGTLEELLTGRTFDKILENAFTY